MLVYSVCTLTPEETQGVIERFREGHPEFEPEDARAYLPPEAAELVDAGGTLASWPHLHGCDGFFAVRLRRR